MHTPFKIRFKLHNLNPKITDLDICIGTLKCAGRPSGKKDYSTVILKRKK
jgi:hypothetical protein